MVVYMIVGKKRKNGTRNGQKTKKISMTKLKDDIERMNEELLRMEARASREKNKVKALEIVNKLWDKQWKFVEELKKKYSFKELDESDETILLLKRRNIIIRVIFSYPSEIVNNLIRYFFEIEKK